MLYLTNHNGSYCTHLSPSHTALKNDGLTPPLCLALWTNFSGFFLSEASSLCNFQGDEVVEKQYTFIAILKQHRLEGSGPGLAHFLDFRLLFIQFQMKLFFFLNLFFPLTFTSELSDSIQYVLSIDVVLKLLRCYGIKELHMFKALLFLMYLLVTS